MADITLTAPQLAKETDALALAALFCSGEKGIGLKPYVCRPDNRPQLVNWVAKECSAHHVWTVNKVKVPVGMLIFRDISLRSDRKKHEILYVVVEPSFRSKGIGPTLIRHIQAQDDIRWLRAEARNPHSEHMLIKCGFQQQLGEYPGQPSVYVWRQRRQRLAGSVSVGEGP